MAEYFEVFMIERISSWWGYLKVVVAIHEELMTDGGEAFKR